MSDEDSGPCVVNHASWEGGVKGRRTCAYLGLAMESIGSIRSGNGSAILIAVGSVEESGWSVRSLDFILQQLVAYEKLLQLGFVSVQDNFKRA